MVAMDDRMRRWTRLRARFERFVFRVGCREAAARTELGLATVNNLVNGTTVPHLRTIRDARLAVEEWERATEPAGLSHSERN